MLDWQDWLVITKNSWDWQDWLVITKNSWGRILLRDMLKTICNRKCFTSHNNNARQFTVKPSSYTNATTSYLIVWLTCLLLCSRITNTKPHTYNIIQCGGSLTSYLGHIYKMIHSNKALILDTYYEFLKLAWFALNRKPSQIDYLPLVSILECYCIRWPDDHQC